MPEENKQGAAPVENAVEEVKDEAVVETPTDEQEVQDSTSNPASGKADEGGDNNEGVDVTSNVSENTEVEVTDDGQKDGILKVKVDGEEVTYDLTDEAHLKEVQKLLSLASGAQKKFQEANQLHKQSTEFLRMLKENPVAVLTNPNLGLDFRAIAEEYLAQQIEFEQLPESERRARTAEHELQQLKRQRELEEEALRVQQEQQEVAALAQKVYKEITEAMDASGLDPKDAEEFELVRSMMQTAAMQGQVLEAKEAADYVARNSRKAVQRSLGQVDEVEKLIEMLGDDVVKKIRQFDANALKSKKPATVTKENQGQKREPQNKKKKKISVSDWRASRGI